MSFNLYLVGYVILIIGLSLLPAFERPEQANHIFVDHVTVAAAAHVVRASTWCGSSSW